MNKKAIFYLLLLTNLALILPSGILAVNPTPKRDTLIPLKQATNPADLTVPPGITRMVETVSTRLGQASETVKRFQTRISSFLEKMRANGVNVSKLDTMAKNIETQIQKLTNDLTQEEKLKEAVAASNNRKNDLKAWRKQVNVVRQDLLNVIKQQKNLVLEMKKLKAATVTAQPTLAVSDSSE